MTRRFVWFPPATAWLSAGLLFTVLQGIGLLAALVVPLLLELMRHSPRLAMLGFLGLALSPAIVIGLAHRFTESVLDRAESKTLRNRRKPRYVGISAGLRGLSVLVATSLLTTLVVLVIFPPEDPDAAV